MVVLVLSANHNGAFKEEVAAGGGGGQGRGWGARRVDGSGREGREGAGGEYIWMIFSIISINGLLSGFLLVFL